MNLTVTLPKNWKPNNQKAFISWMLKIKNVHYTQIK